MSETAEFTLEGLRKVAEQVWEREHVTRTPQLHGIERLPKFMNLECSLSFKLESMQNTGSFKFRSASHQVTKALTQVKPGQPLLTFSGGNYGKAFATVVNGLADSAERPSLVLMPETSPADRAHYIESLGSRVEKHPICDLPAKIGEYVAAGYRYFDPYDDRDVIEALASVAFEMLQEGVPDVVLVPCGGGGLLSGIAAGLKLSPQCADTRIYAVEPESACTMHMSFEQGSPAVLSSARSVASGLCPPYCGKLTYAVSRQFVDGVLLVSDEEIVQAVKVLHSIGLLVEPSGAAGVAALLTGKLPIDITGKKVVVVISGRNVTLKDLDKLIS